MGEWRQIDDWFDEQEAEARDDIQDSREYFAFKRMMEQTDTIETEDTDGVPDLRRRRS